MMTKLKKILLGCVGAGMFAVLPLAQAQNPGPDGSSPKFHGGQRIQEIYNQLNLTDEQKKLLEVNKQQHTAIMERVHQEMKTCRESFQEELMKPQLDMPRINELHRQIKSLLSQVEDTKLSSILAVRAILTPDQFTEFLNLMHKRKRAE